VGHVECTAEMRKITKSLYENVNGKLRRFRTRCRREDSIKMDLKATGYDYFVLPSTITLPHKIDVFCPKHCNR
jgi:hypothetical protein